MQGRRLIGWASIIVIVAITALVGYSVWFCAGALHGDIEGCVASAIPATLLSPPVMIALAAAVSGLIFAQTRPR